MLDRFFSKKTFFLGEKMGLFFKNNEIFEKWQVFFLKTTMFFFFFLNGQIVRYRGVNLV